VIDLLICFVSTFLFLLSFISFVDLGAYYVCLVVHSLLFDRVMQRVFFEERTSVYDLVLLIRASSCCRLCKDERPIDQKIMYKG